MNNDLEQADAALRLAIRHLSRAMSMVEGDTDEHALLDNLGREVTRVQRVLAVNRRRIRNEGQFVEYRYTAKLAPKRKGPAK